jgi:hypothetical protein
LSLDPEGPYREDKASRPAFRRRAETAPSSTIAGHCLSSGQEEIRYVKELFDEKLRPYNDLADFKETRPNHFPFTRPEDTSPETLNQRQFLT